MTRPTGALPKREIDRNLCDAFDVHRALIVAEIGLPYLRDNPRWQILRMDAYETFHNLMEGRRDAN